MFLRDCASVESTLTEKKEVRSENLTGSQLHRVFFGRHLDAAGASCLDGYPDFIVRQRGEIIGTRRAATDSPSPFLSLPPGKPSNR